MKRFIYQTNKNECGLACVKMLLASKYKDDKFLYLPHEEKTSAYNLFELKEIAKKYGLILSGYIVNSFKLLPKKGEFILIKNNSSGGKHAILVKKRFEYFSYIYDPSEGKKLVLNKKLFNNIEEKMEIMCVDSFTPVTTEFNIEPLISNKDKTIVLTLELLSVIAFFFSAYFVDSSSHFLYPIVGILLGVLFSIAFRTYNFKTMKKFDEEFIRYTYDPNLRIRRRNYKLMHKTKSGILTNNATMLLNISSALAVNVVLVLSSPHKIYIILASAILILLDYAFFTPKVNKEMDEVERSENNLLLDDKVTKENYESSYEEIKEESYKVAKRVEFKKVIIMFALLVTTFFMSAMVNRADIDYVLLNFAMCLFTYTSLNNGMNCYYKNKESIINETKFYDLINKHKE